MRKGVKAGTIYAFYKGDEYVTMGTAREIAKSQNLKVETVYWMHSPSYLERTKDKIDTRATIVIVDDIEDDEAI